MVLMISGGIGITPMYSIANELLHEYKNEGRNLKKLKFVWVIRSFDIMDAILKNSMDIESMMDGTDSKQQGSTIFSLNADSVVDLDVHVTKKSAKKKRHVELDTESAITEKVAYKRPNLLKIFEKMKDAALVEGETHIAVCACGPKRLVDSCRELSREFSDGICQQVVGEGVTFDFHEETFEF